MAMDKETREYLEQKYTGLVGKDDLEKLRQEMKAGFGHLKEEGKETRSGLGELKAGLNQMQEQAKQLVAGVRTLNEKVQAGTVEVKEELGAMIKFSYADLEKKLNALEARIQVLEKIVLQPT